MSLLKAQAALKSHLYINGTWVSSASTFRVIAPATGALLANAPLATSEHVNSAVTAAATGKYHC